MNYNKKKETISKHRASASVMMLIMAVIVISLGFAYVFINNTNKDLASKNKTWILDYYRLESVMDERISRVESFLNHYFQDEDNSKKYIEKIDELNNDGLLKEFSCEVRLFDKDAYEKDLSDEYDLEILLFLDNKNVENLNLKSNIGISVSLLYNINTKDLKILYKKEVPPELEYESFY